MHGWRTGHTSRCPCEVTDSSTVVVLDRSPAREYDGGTPVRRRGSDAVKVRVTFTVDVDPDAWSREYGVPRADVRKDINEWAMYGLRAHIADLGLAPK